MLPDSRPYAATQPQRGIHHSLDIDNGAAPAAIQIVGASGGSQSLIRDQLHVENVDGPVVIEIAREAILHECRIQ
jgi:hypothetical protein